MRAYGVSRNAVREALDLLRSEGLVERRQGAGTFVVARKELHEFDRLRSVTDGLLHAVDVRFETLTAETLPAPPQVADTLRGEVGEPTVFIERLMVLDGTPFSIRSSWMPADLASPLLDVDLERDHYYTLVARALGVRLTKGHLVIEAVNAGDRAASLLGVVAGAPLFLMSRTSVLESGRPFEFGFTRSRADRVALVAEMDVDDIGPDAVADRGQSAANDQPSGVPPDALSA